MGIGASVFLLAIGAIITFAFNIRVGWLDLDVVGWILMAVGAFGLVFSLTMMNRRRTVVVTQPVQPTQPVYPDQRVVEQRTQYDVDRPV
jgi:hypothetical protein